MQAAGSSFAADGWAVAMSKPRLQPRDSVPLPVSLANVVSGGNASLSTSARREAPTSAAAGHAHRAAAPRRQGARSPQAIQPRRAAKAEGRCPWQASTALQ